MQQGDTSRPASDRRGLEDFAPEARTQCVTCQLPSDVREEVERCRRRDPKRFSYPVICAWLRAELDVAVTESSLKRHMAHHAGAHQQ
jgi:hypothetical protein